MSNYFIPLGGGNEIGASAYFLSIDNTRILLDCGARLTGEELYPDYARLHQEGIDISDIDLIIVSHGHYDHIGSFAQIAASAPNAEIFMTSDTKRLIEMQLLDFGRISGRQESVKVKNERYRRAQAFMARIQVKPVFRSFQAKGCRITFMPAGHMIGAVMIRIESKNCDVLYSGDYSMTTMSGVNELRLCPDLKPNVLLLNAPNAYSDMKIPSELPEVSEEKPETRYESNHYTWLERKIQTLLQEKRNIYLISRSIPKHLELLYFLKTVFPEVPVFLEPKSKVIVDALSDMGYFVYSENIHGEESVPEISQETEASIFIGQDSARKGCVPVKFDTYTLHASIPETIDLIKTVQADTVYLLHVKPESKKKSLISMMKEYDHEKQITQTINGLKYYIPRRRNMLYEKIYHERMKKELLIAQEQLNKSKATNEKSIAECIAIYGSLRYPQMHPRDAFNQIEWSEFVGYKISYNDYLEALKSVNLDGKERRLNIHRRVENGITCIKKALDGDQAAAEKLIELTDNLMPRDTTNGKMFFLGKCIVVFMLFIDPEMQNDTYKLIGLMFGAKYCNKLLYRIRDSLLKEHGMTRKKKTAKDVLKKTEKALTETTEAEAAFANGDELERLRFANQNYKNSLELVQSMLDELNETIDESAADAKNLAIASFYSNMNSDEYGNLLDSIELVERRLKQIKEQKVKIPPQVLPLTIVFKQLLRFIKESGITPIDVTGREFEAEFEELADYTYIGEAYTEAGEKKTVVVERPGWKFESNVISLPTVREKED